MKPSALHYAQAFGHETTDKRLDILQRIGEVGSISEAARGANVSYKAAWQGKLRLTNMAIQRIRLGTETIAVQN